MDVHDQARWRDRLHAQVPHAGSFDYSLPRAPRRRGHGRDSRWLHDQLVGAPPLNALEEYVRRALEDVDRAN
jgi:hypothetical protein